MSRRAGGVGPRVGLDIKIKKLGGAGCLLLFSFNPLFKPPTADDPFSSYFKNRPGKKFPAGFLFWDNIFLTRTLDKEN